HSCDHPSIACTALLPRGDLILLLTPVDWKDERGDALDVRRVREHVDGGAALERVPEVVAEHGEVGGERRRVAGDVDESARLERAGAAQRLAGEARPGRVDDDDVGRPRLLSK